MKKITASRIAAVILCTVLMAVMTAGVVSATDPEYDGSTIWVLGTDFMDATAQIEGDHMAYTYNDTYAIYDGLDFGKGNDYYAFRILAGSPKSGDCQGGSVEIRIGDPEGELIGTLPFTPKLDGSWSNYEEHAVVIEKPELLSGSVDICLVFKTNATFLFNYSEFWFDTEEVVATAEEEEEDAPDIADLTYDGVVWKEGIDVSDLSTMIEGDHIGFTTMGSYSLYKYLYFADGCDHYDFTICMGAPEGQGGFVEAHLGAADGELIASVEITPTGDWGAYQEFTAAAEKPELLKGLVDICLVFYPYGDATYTGNYTEFWFEGDSVNIPEEEPEAVPAETEAAPEDTAEETDASTATETEAPAESMNNEVSVPDTSASDEAPASEGSAAPVIIVCAVVVIILAVVIIVFAKKKK